LVAVTEGHVPIVSQIITARCNVDIAKMDGTTPFFIVAKHGHVAVVAQLISAQCNVNLPRTNGLTSFLMVTTKGHMVVVKKLITTIVTSTFVVGMSLKMCLRLSPWYLGPLVPLICVLPCVLSIQSNTTLCLCRMSLLGNFVLFTQHLVMYTLTTAQQILISSSKMIGQNLPHLLFSNISSKITIPL
jgi:hypothetical protein